jgi:hypothetical protein
VQPIHGVKVPLVIIVFWWSMTNNKKAFGGCMLLEFSVFSVSLIMGSNICVL